MSLKRRFEEISRDEQSEEAAGIFKNSLDSDEDDDEAEEESRNVMNDDDFEGMEEGPSTDTNIGFTAFNMDEELEEGYITKEGDYVLHKKDNQIRDNWLDNIDWVKVKPVSTEDKKYTKGERSGIADSDSDSDEDPDKSFDPISLYKQIIEFLQPGETVKRALCRLGRGKKQLTTAERWKRKKNPELAKEDDEKSAQIVKLTELANEILTRTGNMDIYEETYEQIKQKIQPPKKEEEVLDMYADDFDVKEKEKLNVNTSEEKKSTENKSESNDEESVTWELKWSQNEDAEVSGPHKTEKMLSWSKEGYFKKGAWVRRTGQEGDFYSAARIDFDLYL